jgi:predicted MFS family arabinose efflux permease
MENRVIVFLIVLVQFVNALDFVIVMPMGPDLAEGLGFKVEEIAWVTGAYTVSAAIVALLVARILDAFDRKKVLMFALLGMVLATALAGISTEMSGLIIARLLAGGFGGIAIAIGISIVADAVSEQHRGKALSMVMAGFPISAIVGIPLGLYLAYVFGWQAAFYLLAGCIAAVTLAVWIFMPSMTSHRVENQGLFSFSEFYRRPELGVGVFAVGICVFPAFLVVPHVSTIIQFNFGFPREYLSFLYLTTGFVNLGFVIATGKIADRCSASKIVLFYVVLFVADVYLWLVVQVNLPVVVFHLVFFVCFTALFIPVGSLTSKLPLPHQRAGFSAVQTFIQHLATGFSAFLSTLFVTSAESGSLQGLDTLGLIVIGISVLIPICITYIERRRRQAAKALVLPVAEAANTSS